MATKVEHGHAHGHDHAQGHSHGHARYRPMPTRVASPLARGLGFRLAWAGGLSALLWLGVVWALQ
ncbi:MAG TPA: hypothetical protein VKQ29_06800 [Aliidongia sp.]|nr:hypothetical protein [Aliidongia sp.]